MEYKIKEVNVTFEDLDNKEVTIKTYITSEDMVTIIDQMLNQPNLILRDSMRDVLILRLCTDIKEFDSDSIDTEVVDYYNSIGVVDKIKSYIVNEKNIDKYMNEYESTSRTLLRLEEDLDATLVKLTNKIESFDAESSINSMVTQLQQVTEK